MRCPKCGSPESHCDEQRSLSNAFYVYLTRNYESHITVPCHVRRAFNHATGNYIVVVTTDGIRFEFDIRKKPEKTHVYGSDYKSFLAQYDMCYGDKILFDMKDDPAIIPIWQETANGEPKDHIGAREDEDNDPGIVFSFGFLLTNMQQERYDMIMTAFGHGVQAVYVHCLSWTDIEHSYLRMPKVITEALDLPETGVAVLSMEGTAGMHANYVKCADGRTRFSVGWNTFARTNDLGPGMDLIMMFYMEDVQPVKIVFHVL